MVISRCPAPAKAPVLRGHPGSPKDPFPAAGDPAELADDWGGGADLVLIEGSFHVPRIEAPEIAAQYFEALFDFID